MADDSPDVYLLSGRFKALTSKRKKCTNHKGCCTFFGAGVHNKFTQLCGFCKI